MPSIGKVQAMALEGRGESVAMLVFMVFPWWR